MKKIILLLSLLINVLCFAEIKGVDLDKLNDVMLTNDYSIDFEDDYVIYKKRDGKFEEELTFFLQDGDIANIKIYSWHHHLQPNQDKIVKNAKKIIQLLNKATTNKQLIVDLNKGVAKIKKDVNKGTTNFDMLELKEYVIRTFNSDKQKEITLSQN